MREITEIILHCSATWSKQDIGVKEIKDWHIRGRGWSHIGYHYVIRRDGQLEEGCPLEVPGIHCSGHNARSIGICLVGGGPNGEDNNFNREQFDMLAKLIGQLRQKFPCTSIHGHNEFANKACPVFSVAKFLTDYGIPQAQANFEWDGLRWPHFKPREFTALWGGGKMPATWEKALDALEELRRAYGKPLVILSSQWQPTARVLICDIRVPASAQAVFITQAMQAGFSSARVVSNGVRVYMGQDV